jgi:predicted DNA-binding protein with PD1-like motif
MKNNSLLVTIGSAKIKDIIQFRVKEGSDLLLAIGEAVQRFDIKSGVIISGIGALRKAVFRNLKVFPKKFPVQRKDRIYYDITDPMELVSLGGWIATGEDGEKLIHAHFVASMVSDEAVTTLGGHLTEGTVAGIKVVVAVAVLEEGKFFANYDQGTQSKDIYSI